MNVKFFQYSSDNDTWPTDPQPDTTQTDDTVPSFVLYLLTSVSLTVSITSPASTCGQRRSMLSPVLYKNLKCISR